MPQRVRIRTGQFHPLVVDEIRPHPSTAPDDDGPRAAVDRKTRQTCPVTPGEEGYRPPLIAADPKARRVPHFLPRTPEYPCGRGLLLLHLYPCGGLGLLLHLARGFRVGRRPDRRGLLTPGRYVLLAIGLGGLSTFCRCPGSRHDRGQPVSLLLLLGRCVSVR